MKQFFLLFAAVLLSCLVCSAPALAEDGKGIDKDYIKEHYPDVYMQIFSEGRKAGLHEAEVREKKTEPREETAAPKKEAELGDWWDHSSLKYEPMPSGYLLHLEGQYNFASLSGNNSGSVYRGGGRFVARKDRLTNYLSYQIDKRKISQSDGGHTDIDYQIFQESLRYDISRKLYAEGGFIWEKDRISLIDNRDIYYAGAGWHVLDLDGFRLDLFAAAGYETELYAPRVMQALGFDRAHHYISYLGQDCLWHIGRRLALHESFRVFTDFEKTSIYNLADDGTVTTTGKTNRYRWKFRTDLDFKLTRNFSFVSSYEINYDNNPWPTVLKRDSVLTTGVKFSY